VIKTELKLDFFILRSGFTSVAMLPKSLNLQFKGVAMVPAEAGLAGPALVPSHDQGMFFLSF
jgi:hypothetical protein